MIFSVSADFKWVIDFEAGENLDSGVPGREDEEHSDEDEGDWDHFEDCGDQDDAEDAAHQTPGDREATDDKPGQDEPTHFLTDFGK